MGDRPGPPDRAGLTRTKGVVRQNIAFSLRTKLVAAAILAAGALPLWGAVVADVGASLVVVGNGLRLARGRPGGASRALPLLDALPVRGRPRARGHGHERDGDRGHGDPLSA